HYLLEHRDALSLPTRRSSDLASHGSKLSSCTPRAKDVMPLPWWWALMRPGSTTAPGPPTMRGVRGSGGGGGAWVSGGAWAAGGRSEEHTSELQSRENVVCRLL